MSFANVGKRWSPAAFPAYLATLKRPGWARTVTIHYTAAPSLAMRPHGFTAQHIENIRDFYKTKYRWNRGPHFFTDDDDIFGMTPPTIAGIHAASFNATSIGIEALGAYDTEDPLTGRGLAVMNTTASTTRALLEWLELEVSSKNILFHRFDPKTTKTCPCRKVLHDWFVDLVRNTPAGTMPATAEPDTGGLGDEEMVPLVTYVAANTGRKISELAVLIRRDEGLWYMGEQWVERAYYDATAKATMAPLSEALEVIAILNNTRPANVDRVPVVETMMARHGITYKSAAARLKFDGSVFRWDGKVIKGATYDRHVQKTVASLSVIEGLA
jgi:hypothetical protein